MTNEQLTDTEINPQHRTFNRKILRSK